MKISVFGLGYVGSVSLACFSSMGHKVIGVDIKDEKNKSINRGKAPIFESGLDDMLSFSVTSGNLRATSDVKLAIQESNISIICVGTPSNSDGSINTRYIEGVCIEIAKYISFKNSYHLFVIRSTIPPGTINNTLIPLIAQYSGKKVDEDFGVTMNPEFLREGSAIDDFFNPERIIIGSNNNKSFSMTSNIYDSKTDKKVMSPIFKTSIELAELSKYVDNSFHALKVSFANEIGTLANNFDVNSKELMNIFCKDKKLNLSSYYFRPGFSFGGSCLPKDVRGINNLAKVNNIETPILNSIIKSNDIHLERYLNFIKKSKYKKLGFLGLTFKKGTDDIRENKVLDIIKYFSKLDDYDIYCFDSILSMKEINNLNFKINYCDNLDQLLNNCNLVVFSSISDSEKEMLLNSKLNFLDLNNILSRDLRQRHSLV